MITRHWEYLAALARERHFARAAAACHVKQSTLSAGIKQMEEALGVLLVERGRRYGGLTPEGAVVLAWARQSISEFEGLRQNLSKMKKDLTGQLRLGVVPAALPLISLLLTPFAKQHSRVGITLRSLSSAEVQRGLDEFSLDAGITYLDDEPLARVRRYQLYTERYMFVAGARGDLREKQYISWKEASTFPLCLFVREMQHRRMIDRHFQQSGATTHAAVEVDSLVALWSLLRFGRWAAVVPHSLLALTGETSGLAVLPLVAPESAHAVGIVASDREPLAPVTRALLDTAKEENLNRRIDLRIDESLRSGHSANRMESYRNFRSSDRD